MRNCSKLFLALFAMLSYTVAHAYGLNAPVHGPYIGMTTGFGWIQPIDNVRIPAIAGISTTTEYATVKNKLGFPIGLLWGYRVKDSLRVEGEMFFSFNKPRKLVFGAINIPNSTYSINGNHNTIYSFFANAYYDFLRKDSIQRYKSFAPFIGVGIGKARMVSKLKVTQNNAIYQVLYDRKPMPTVFQFIIGGQIYADDYTTIGVDYRMLKYQSIANYTSGFISHTLNMTMYFIFDHPMKRIRGAL